MIPSPGYYWPPGATRGEDPDSLRTAFEAIGYSLCSGGNVEVGFEKISIYVDTKGRWQHAARQEKNGTWVSKLGDEEDVNHQTEHCFGGSIYGTVVYYMKRPIANQVPQVEDEA